MTCESLYTYVSCSDRLITMLMGLYWSPPAPPAAPGTSASDAEGYVRIVASGNSTCPSAWPVSSNRLKDGNWLQLPLTTTTSTLIMHDVKRVWEGSRVIIRLNRGSHRETVSDERYEKNHLWKNLIYWSALPELKKGHSSGIHDTSAWSSNLRSMIT